MRWAGYVARMGREEVNTGIWCGSLSERDKLEDSCVDWRMILKWMLRKWDGGHGVDCSGSE